MWTATLTGELVDLRHIDPAERLSLHADRAIPFVCRGCGGRVHMRLHPGDESDEPFVTFAHHPGEGERCRALGFHVEESPEHHRLKDAIARSAKDAGWSVELEVPGDGCRADVVATRKGASRVLEAQLSPLGTEEAIRRTDLYTREFGPTTWTHTRVRPWSTRIESVRVDDGLDTVVGGVFLDQEGSTPAPPTPLADTIPRIVAGELRWVYYHAGGEEIGYFTPIGAVSTGKIPARVRRAANRSKRGTFVTECVRVSSTIPCSACGSATLAGQPCPNTTCAPRECDCGMRLWRNQSECPSCGRRDARV
jgi:hypothetical protein